MQMVTVTVVSSVVLVDVSLGKVSLVRVSVEVLRVEVSLVRVLVEASLVKVSLVELVGSSTEDSMVLAETLVKPVGISVPLAINGIFVVVKLSCAVDVNKPIGK